MLKKYISKGLMIAGVGLASLACTDLTRLGSSKA